MLPACKEEKMDKLRLDTGRLGHVAGGVRKEEIRVPFSRLELVAVPEHYMYENIVYVANPVDPERQQMSIYFHPAYLNGKSVNGFTAKTAPVLLHIEGGGFKWQHIIHLHEHPRVMTALQRGYVVVCPNFRGPDDHKIDIDGDGEPEWTGTSPAGLLDLKAAVRYLRHNDDLLPGDFSKIIASGCSSGGAMSALVASSGNTHRFDEALKKMGAADERDNIYACGNYFGPTALGICDMAYDWLFGRGTYETTVIEQKMPIGEPRRITAAATENGLPRMLTQGKTPYELYTVYGKMFVDEYISGKLHMTEREYVQRLLGYILPAYRDYRVEHPEGREGDYFYFETYEDYLAAGYEPDPFYSEETYPASGGYINWNLFRAYNSQYAHKGSPSFDLLKKDEMYMSENALFGDEKTGVAQFTEYGAAHGELATGTLSPEIARRVADQDPFSYIETGDSNCAKHWYIRHGTADGDIPITLSVDLAELLKSKGIDTTVRIAYNCGHSGDEEMREVLRLLEWYERILTEEVNGK
jgi:hypothetical protein